VIRSLLFYLVYIPLVGFFGLFSGTLGWLLPFRWRQHVVAMGNYMMLGWFGLACGVRFQVTGLENIPARPFVALSKHQSGWETYYLQAILRPVCTILKRELLRYPFFGWGLAAMRPIAIDRSNPREALRQVMKQGQLRINEGNNVVIYPEGTRTDPGQVGNYGRSGAALAIGSLIHE
jgi:1-acyl-sn-glycerol-3-phosphate acyltransferase